MKNILLIYFLSTTCFIVFAQNKLTSNFLLNTFKEKEIPNDIAGASGLFYRSKKDRKEGKYIAAIDLGRVAYIKLGNKLERFVQTKYVDGRYTIFSYKGVGSSIQLKITIKTSKPVGDEDATVIGTLALKTADGKYIEIPIVGDVGD